MESTGRKVVLSERLAEALKGEVADSTAPCRAIDIGSLVDSALAVFEGGLGSHGSESASLGAEQSTTDVVSRTAALSSQFEAVQVEATLGKTVLDNIERPAVEPGYSKRPPPVGRYFDFQSTELTDAVRHDLEVLRMRTFINPKKHYKGSDHKWNPNQFQVGTVVLPAHEYYSQGGSKRELRKGALDSLKGDTAMLAYTKRKFMETQASTQAGGKKAYKSKMKKRRPKWAQT